MSFDINGLNKNASAEAIYITTKNEAGQSEISVIDCNSTEKEIQDILGKIKPGSVMEIIVKDNEGNYYKMKVENCECANKKFTVTENLGNHKTNKKLKEADRGFGPDDGRYTAIRSNNGTPIEEAICRAKALDYLKKNYPGKEITIEKTSHGDEYRVGTEKEGYLVFEENHILKIHDNARQEEGAPVTLKYDETITTPNKAKDEINRQTGKWVYTGDSTYGTSIDKPSPDGQYAEKDASDIQDNRQINLKKDLGSDYTVEKINYPEGKNPGNPEGFILANKDGEKFLAIKIREKGGKFYYQIYKFNDAKTQQELYDKQYAGQKNKPGKLTENGMFKKIYDDMNGKGNASTHTSNVFYNHNSMLPTTNYAEYNYMFAHGKKGDKAPGPSGNNTDPYLFAGITQSEDISSGNTYAGDETGKHKDPSDPGTVEYTGDKGFNLLGMFYYAKSTGDKGIYEQGSTLTPYGKQLIKELVFLYKRGLISKEEITKIIFTTSYEGAKDSAENKDFNNKELSKRRAQAFFKEFNSNILENNKKIEVTDQMIDNAAGGEIDHDREFRGMQEKYKGDAAMSNALNSYENAHLPPGKNGIILDKNTRDESNFKKWAEQYGIKEGSAEYNELLAFHKSGQKHRAGQMNKKLKDKQEAQAWDNALQEYEILTKKESILKKALPKY